MKTQSTDRWRYRKNTAFKEKREEETGWEALAFAIIRQAVEEYRDADRIEKGIIKYSSICYGSPKLVKAEIVKFFRSQWYGTLCDIDPDRILRKLGAIK